MRSDGGRGSGVFFFFVFLLSFNFARNVHFGLVERIPHVISHACTRDIASSQSSVGYMSVESFFFFLHFLSRFPIAKYLPKLLHTAKVSRDILARCLAISFTRTKIIEYTYVGKNEDYKYYVSLITFEETNTIVVIHVIRFSLFPLPPFSNGKKIYIYKVVHIFSIIFTRDFVDLSGRESVFRLTFTSRTLPGTHISTKLATRATSQSFSVRSVFLSFFLLFCFLKFFIHLNPSANFTRLIPSNVLSQRQSLVIDEGEKKKRLCRSVTSRTHPLFFLRAHSSLSLIVSYIHTWISSLSSVINYLF